MFTTQTATGEQIPSVRKIAEEYGVSVGTARRALVVLREAGLTEVTPSWALSSCSEQQYLQPDPASCLSIASASVVRPPSR